MLRSGMGRYMGNSLTLWQDIARCTDKTAGQNAKLIWQRQTPAMASIYKTMNDEDKEYVKTVIKAYHVKRANRAPAAWICRSGIDAYVIATEKGLTKTTEAEVNGKQHSNIETLPSVDPYLKYLDDAAWQEKRTEVYESFLTSLDKPAPQKP